MPLNRQEINGSWAVRDEHARSPELELLHVVPASLSQLACRGAPSHLVHHNLGQGLQQAAQRLSKLAEHVLEGMTSLADRHVGTFPP